MSIAPNVIWLQWLGMDQADVDVEYPEGWDGPQDEDIFWSYGRHYDTDVRYVKAGGPEWDALMERARDPQTERAAATALRDLLAYFGEKP